MNSVDADFVLMMMVLTKDVLGPRPAYVLGNGQAAAKGDINGVGRICHDLAPRVELMLRSSH